MDELISSVIAAASELAVQARAGSVDPSLAEQTKERTRRLYAALGTLPPPVRRRAQRLVQDAAAIIAQAERRLQAQRPPPAPAPEPAPPAPAAAATTTAPGAVAAAGAGMPPPSPAWRFDLAQVRSGIVWAAILGPPRGADPGW